MALARCSPLTAQRARIPRPALPCCTRPRLPAASRPLQPTSTRAVPEHTSTQTIQLQLLGAASFLAAPAALAQESVGYDPSGGSDFIKNVTGVAYIGLVGFFLYRLFTKRAKRAREERVTSTPIIPAQPPQPEPEIDEANVTPLNTFIGAAQAGLLGAGLWFFTTKVQASFDDMAMPMGYTAQNISITVRTIILGLCYLATFVFAMNSLGLTGLTLQLLFFPDTVDKTPEPKSRPTGPQLPKVGLTSNTDDVRRAFEVAEQQGLQEGAKRDKSA